MRDSTVSTIFASPIVRDHYSALSPLSSASHCSYRKCLHGHAECLHCSYHGIDCRISMDVPKCPSTQYQRTMMLLPPFMLGFSI